jgi:hypothetical protein
MARKFILELDEDEIDWLLNLHKWLKKTGEQRNIRIALEEIILKPLLKQISKRES